MLREEVTWFGHEIIVYIYVVMVAILCSKYFDRCVNNASQVGVLKDCKKGQNQ